MGEKMKKFLLVCNFKMNSVPLEKYELAFGSKKFENVVLCPNFCDIFAFSQLKEQNAIKIGAQNVGIFDGGAHTGEISAQMLKNVGVDFCIVGHSERRKENFEDSLQINQKAKLLLSNGITPILCVGEPLAHGKNQIDFALQFVKTQIEQALDGIDKSKVIVAYEPIWAIGTGKSADVSHISKVSDFVKNQSQISTCLYGGSLNENNLLSIAKIASVDGVLIGSKSLDPFAIAKMSEMIKQNKM